MKRRMCRNTMLKIVFHSEVKYLRCNKAELQNFCVFMVIEAVTLQKSLHYYSDGPVILRFKSFSVHLFEGLTFDGLYMEVWKVKYPENRKSICSRSLEPHQIILTRKCHYTLIHSTIFCRLNKGKLDLKHSFTQLCGLIFVDYYF